MLSFELGTYYLLVFAFFVLYGPSGPVKGVEIRARIESVRPDITISSALEKWIDRERMIAGLSAWIYVISEDSSLNIYIGAMVAFFAYALIDWMLWPAWFVYPIPVSVWDKRIRWSGFAFLCFFALATVYEGHRACVFSLASVFACYKSLAMIDRVGPIPAMESAVSRILVVPGSVGASR